MPDVHGQEAACRHQPGVRQRPLAEFEAGDDHALYRGAGTIDWSQHLGADSTLAVDFTGIKAAITHSRFAAQRVKDAVVDQLREAIGDRPSVDVRQPDVRINVHMHRNEVTVAIDLSGESLHKRGYRETGIAAPLKENLAAAVLYRADWPAVAGEGGGFVDPLCGSGTLLVEAAWMAADTAPGLLRTHFGFLGWRGHDDVVWKDLVDDALERQEAGLEKLPPIVGYDHDRQAVRLALANVERAGLHGRVHVERREIGEAAPPKGVDRGLVATNPPLVSGKELHHSVARWVEVVLQSCLDRIPGASKPGQHLAHQPFGHLAARGIGDAPEEDSLPGIVSGCSQGDFYRR